MIKKLTIICITYNQVKFIRQTIESFLMQKTDFNFEILIHDDCSTDGTREIIKEYEKKYPNIIKPIYQEENQWSKGNPSIIFNDFIFPKIDSEYVALCEGDDYWIDENKLQKQVDFLDKNKKYNICFHPVKVIWEDKSEKDSIFPDKKLVRNKTKLGLKHLLKHNFIQTNSVVYRWNSGIKIPDNILPIDWFIHLLNVRNGKIYFMKNDVMSVYRRWDGGIWIDNGTDDFFIKNGVKIINFYKQMGDIFGTNYKKNIQYVFNRMMYACINKQKFDELKNQLGVDVIDGLCEYSYKKYSLLKCIKYYILSKICFGKVRRKYVDKYMYYKKVVGLF